MLFDIDAIRRELTSEDLQGEVLQIKQLESMLPPTQFDLRPDASPYASSATRQIKSADATAFPMPLERNTPSEPHETTCLEDPQSAPLPNPGMARPEVDPVNWEQNAWADEDDGGGKEREVVTSFE